MPDVFGLYLVLTEPVAGYEHAAAAAVETGVGCLQLRMKKRPPSEVLEMARRLRRITASSPTRFIVNDDVEIARQADADGVHLGQDDLSIAEARLRWPAPSKIFGLSTHNEDQELRARDVGPDYIGVGPVFPTPTKEHPDPTLGLERMGRIIRGSPLTAVAIGGVNADNLADVLRHGAVNFCVLRAVNQAAAPAAAIRRLQGIWNGATARSIR